MGKRLRLTRERLAELTTDELASVAAGGQVVLTGMETYGCPTLPVKQCTEATQRCFTGTTGYTFTCYSWAC